MTIGVFGRFDPLGYFTRLNGYRRAEIGELLSLLESGQDSVASGRSFAPLGTYLHEMVHCFQMASTPFGQFWTRALLSQGLFASLVFRGVFEDRKGTRIELPLDATWQPVVGMRRQWRAVDEYLAALVSPTNLSIEEACRAHGETHHFIYQFGYLDRDEQQRSAAATTPLASGIGQLNANPMWGDVPISTANLVETHARILENEFLRSQGDEQSSRMLANQMDAAQDTIVMKLLAGYHDEMYSYSAAMQQTMIALIDLALFAPLDPALAPLWSRVLLWEDIHPAYRYMAGAKITKDVGLLDDIDDMESYQNQICKLAGWHTPRQIIDALLPRLSQVTVYDRFFAICLEHRRERPTLFSCGLPVERDLFSPITIFDDQLLMKESALNPPEQSDRNVQQLFESYAVHKLAQQLLFDAKIEVPEPLRHTGLPIDQIILANFFVRI